MRAFIAIEIPEELKEEIIKLQNEIVSKVGREKLKLVERENLHITIKFLGEISDRDVKIIKEKIEEVCRKKIPFSISLIGLGVFPNEDYIRVIWVGGKSRELEEIAEGLNRELNKELGLSKEEFKIHLTVSRVKEKINIKDILEKYKEKKFGEFEVKEIKLKKSTLTPAGPIYEDL